MSSSEDSSSCSSSSDSENEVKVEQTELNKPDKKRKKSHTKEPRFYFLKLKSQTGSIDRLLDLLPMAEIANQTWLEEDHLKDFQVGTTEEPEIVEVTLYSFRDSRGDIERIFEYLLDFMEDAYGSYESEILENHNILRLPGWTPPPPKPHKKPEEDQK